LKSYIENKLKQNKILKNFMTRQWDRTANRSKANVIRTYLKCE